MLETQILAHMFGATIDQEFIDHWAKVPIDGSKAQQSSPLQELELKAHSALIF